MSGRFDVGNAAAHLARGRPLLVVDADEVLLKFVDGFDRFLRVQGLYLDLLSYRLHGNVKRITDDASVLDVEVTALLDEFRRDLDSLEMVDGARDALSRLSLECNIVVLSNVTPEQAISRLRNFAAHGIAFPLVSNNGPKGPAVKALAAYSGKPVFFVDDIPQHLASVAITLPDVLRVHLIGDKRLKPLLPKAEHAHIRADDWREAEAFIRSHLDGA